MRITCLRLSNVMDPQEYAKFEGWQTTRPAPLNMWTYIDNRDAAQAIECAIRYEARGKDAFLITNDENGDATRRRGASRPPLPEGGAAQGVSPATRSSSRTRRSQARPWLQARPPLDRRGLRVMTGFDHLGFLGFDTFGTVVDWRSGVARRRALPRPPWHRRRSVRLRRRVGALYQPAMEEVRSGRRPGSASTSST